MQRAQPMERTERVVSTVLRSSAGAPEPSAGPTRRLRKSRRAQGPPIRAGLAHRAQIGLPLLSRRLLLALARRRIKQAARTPASMAVCEFVLPVPKLQPVLSVG